MGQKFLCYLYLLLLTTVSKAQRKPGDCPKPLPIPVCEKTCFNDSKCSGTAKCCRTDCNGSVCVEAYRPHPVITRNKLGYCPPRLSIPECRATCQEDHQCSGEAKCCKTDCNGYVCIDPIFNLPPPSGAKPGFCPKRLNIPVCQEICVIDDQCASDGKCCKTDCGGAVCVQPKMETVTQLAIAAQQKPGRCPGRLNIPVCTEACDGDHQCAGDAKCCRTNCYGLVCVDPILDTAPPASQKPGSCPPRLKLSICTATCANDYSCSGNTKCCHTECGGTVCTQPNAEAIAPPPPPPLPQSPPSPPDNSKQQCPASPSGPWVCTSTCSSDKDCRGKRKCCKNRCGAHVCTKLSN
ncbi:hypothetical protein PPYR_06560 [Photinus pyralis]|uniref:WAP domain-containing protein n=2 Tax=Photinus pyralis TaxID=7054 RepID=A0A5N4ATZ7_PHOPY|nr:WAP four-disulfide core domain protein 3-like [Photinus pyralis]KAB0800821.1 hypothetical protein PPYR_06560 [Photinus pyralis]